jgi:hypothetical protein
VEKRYQVFISSTFTDLKDERQEVLQALLELGAIPVGMELFPAADDRAWLYIQKVIAECDYYVLIIGGRYGSIDAETGLSFTEKEYDFAVSRNLPVLAFLHGDPGKIVAEKVDLSQKARGKLDAFRTKVQEDKLCKFWKSTQELGALVSRSFIQAKERYPAVGWVRGDLVPDESAAQQINRLRTEADSLRGRLAELNKKGPPGTEDFAQGEDEVAVYYEFQFARENNPQDSFVQTTWDEVFAAASQVLLTSISTANDIRVSLNDFINFKTYASKAHRIWVRQDCLDQIIIQLRSLGLIEPGSIVQRLNRGSIQSWQLTPYGEQEATRLKAIRRHPRGQ